MLKSTPRKSTLRTTQNKKTNQTTKRTLTTTKNKTTTKKLTTKNAKSLFKMNKRGLISTHVQPTYTNEPQTAPRILITGAGGQVGYEITRELRKMYGTNNVIATDGTFFQGHMSHR
jgi:FlaA1/EpsC-like NDP-sugar epimerase